MASGGDDGLGSGDTRRRTGSARRLQPLAQLLGRRHDRARLLPVTSHELREDRRQPAARPSHTIPRWEVGAGEERIAFGRHDHRHGPSAAAGERVHRAHVDVVDVRALLPVHLDGDEVLVEEGGDLLVLEGFPLHHVAPMAGAVADAEEHGLAFGPRPREGLLPPREPVDGVVGVLLQVRARLEDQAVHVARAPVLAPMLGPGHVTRPLGGQRGAQPLHQPGVDAPNPR